MSGPLATGLAGLVDDVVGVEVTVDGMLVIADRMHLVDFPTTLGIRPNIPQEELRQVVWDQVQRDLTAQGVLDHQGQPHPAVGPRRRPGGGVRPDRSHSPARPARHVPRQGPGRNMVDGGSNREGMVHPH